MCDFYVDIVDFLRFVQQIEQLHNRWFLEHQAGCQDNNTEKYL